MSTRTTIVLALALVLLALPVAAYQVCWDTIVTSAGGGCISWTTCQIYDDVTLEYRGTIRGPFQQCG